MLEARCYHTTSLFAFPYLYHINGFFSYGHQGINQTLYYLQWKLRMKHTIVLYNSRLSVEISVNFFFSSPETSMSMMDTLANILLHYHLQILPKFMYTSTTNKKDEENDQNKNNNKITWWRRYPLEMLIKNVRSVYNTLLNIIKNSCIIKFVRSRVFSNVRSTKVI